MTADRPRVCLLATQTRNRELLVGSLEHAGYDVSGAGTIDAFDTLVDDSADVALAVVDLDGLTPAVWSRCERLQDRNVPVLVLSRNLTSQIRQQAYSVGVYRTLQKPIRKAELWQTIQQAIPTPPLNT